MAIKRLKLQKKQEARTIYQQVVITHAAAATFWHTPSSDDVTYYIQITWYLCTWENDLFSGINLGMGGGFDWEFLYHELQH